MATRRRNLQLSSTSIDLNICRPTNLSRLFHLKQKPSAAASSSDSDSAPMSDSESEARWMTFGRLGRSVAVEKHSDDPYLDFRHSMVQMIVEKEIYSKDDLRGLLRCFLHLNSPSHHPIILTVFSEIWDSVFSPVSPPLFRF